MSATKLVLKSTTSTSLNDRFSQIMGSRRTEEPTRQPFGAGRSGIQAGSEKNRRFAEELERRSQPSRRPVANRIGDVGQGGARGFSASLRQSGIRKQTANMAGRVGKRNSSGGAGNVSARQSANRALAKATSMLRDTERELSQLKSVARGSNQSRGGKRGGATRGGGASRGGAGATRGRGGARGGGRGGKTSRKPATVEDLDSEMDAYMLKTKGGLDAQMDDYMSKTKKGLDAQMDDYMNQKSS
ncbi:unnamed protein product [Oikopleura dioica]|uniref:Chromatin target of PRMT1 protein C-terminal domain-containing protein n=1 Tax=Oikopleura dioica TaxID=34765 RepID=E4WVZ5_OIKDI|nr:unnamed protein product [Oikopleura dioica]